MNDFLNIGFDSYVSVSKILVITAPTRGWIKVEINKRKSDKDNPRLYDMSKNKGVRSVLIMDDGLYILSSVSPETLTKRVLKFDKNEEGSN